MITLLRSWAHKHLQAPPQLPNTYTMADFLRFMREETFLYSRRYARRRITMHGQEHLLSAVRSTGAIAAFLHYGSWVLAGGAIAHGLRLPYTVVASRRNIEVLAPEDQQFWRGVHQRGQRLYGHPFFYTDQSPRGAVKWLKTQGNALGVVLDVREHNQQYDEQPFQFLGKTIFMQTGPARLACIAGVPLVPTAIQYHPNERRHHLHFYDPVLPDNNFNQMTQQVLTALEKQVVIAPEQQFHDIVAEFSRRNKQE